MGIFGSFNSKMGNSEFGNYVMKIDSENNEIINYK